MNIEGNFQVTLWRHWWCHHDKYLFGHNLGRYSHIWCQIETVFHILAFSKWLPFWGRAKVFFLPWVIPEVDYASQIVITVNDILSLWSMSKLKYSRRYGCMKFRLILGPVDDINEFMKMNSYKHSHNPMTHTYSKFNDNIVLFFLVIMKNNLISFLKEYRGPNWRPRCKSSMASSPRKNFFWYK